MPTQAERRQQMRRLAELPRRLAEAVRGLTEEQLLTPYRDGGWTPAQVVHHLADSHLNAYIRTRLALTEERPTIKPYFQERWAELVDAKSTNLPPSFAILRGVHRRWTALLHSLRKEDWGRTFFHPEAGKEMTVDDLLDYYSAHGENHVAQIRGLRERRGW